MALITLVALVHTVAGVSDGDMLGSSDEQIALKASEQSGGDVADTRWDGGGNIEVHGSGDGDEKKHHSPSFAVYRMLGNDMWPLQGVGQIRRNSVFAAKYENKPPPNVPVFWIINRIVNATERLLLIDELKNAGVEENKILHVNPPLSAAACLIPKNTKGNTKENMSSLLLLAQAQNSVRNAAVAHALANGFDWVLPLDGNQFVPSDFYKVMSDSLTAADEKNRVAMLIPMLRVREEQVLEVYNDETDFKKIAQNHLRDEGKFTISEPQLAVHSSNAKNRNFEFDDNATYGKGNKAGLLRQLCPYSKTTMTYNADHQSDGHCCELVQMKLRQQGDAFYYGGELDLKKYVQRTNKKKELSDDALTELTLDSAGKLFGHCGATVRLFNYPPEDLTLTQEKIATSVLTRAKTRDTASAVFEKYLTSYFRNVDSPSDTTCASVDMTRVTLTVSDPDTTTQVQAQAMTNEMRKVKQAVIDWDKKKTPRLKTRPKNENENQVVSSDEQVDSTLRTDTISVEAPRKMDKAVVMTNSGSELGSGTMSRLNTRTNRDDQQQSVWRLMATGAFYFLGAQGFCAACVMVVRRMRRRRMRGVSH